MSFADNVTSKGGETPPSEEVMERLSMKLRFIVIITALVGCAVAQYSSLHEFSGEHIAGDRVGGHGMALFGHRNYYLSHIPVFSRPHNEQLAMKVELTDRDGQLIDHDFGTEGYSLSPDTHISLDDMANAEVTTYTGTIHKGNYEHGGPAVFADVTIRIESVLIARNLPGNNEIDDGVQHYFLLGDEKEAFLLNYIRLKRGYQQVISLKDSGLSEVPGLSPLKALLVSVKSKDRLPGQMESVFTLERSGTEVPPTFELSTEKELWCLKGPDFFQPCQSL